MSKDVEVVVIGSLTKDLIGNDLRLGGPAYYCVLSLVQLGVNTKLICSADDDLYTKLLNWGVKVLRCGFKGPIFRLTYLSNGSRRVELLRRGDDITLSDEEIEEILGSASAVIVNPVIKEISLELVRKIKSMSRFLAIDMQGFVREHNDGLVKYSWSDESYEVVKLANLIHLSIDELPPNKDVLEAIDLLRSLTKATVVISMDFRGSVVAIEDGKVHRVPALPGIDGYSTGTGDVMLATMTYSLVSGYDVLTSIALGTVAAGLRVRRLDPPWFTLNELLSTYPKVMKGVKDYNL